MLEEIRIDTTTLSKNLKKYLNGRRAYSEKVIKSTVSDLRSRAPGWIASEVVKVYNLKKSELTPQKGKGVGSVKVQGETIDTLAIRYQGRKLTPIHFKMKPTKRPKWTTLPSGKKKKPRDYVVTSEVLKGQRKEIKGAFVGDNPNSRGQLLAWKRDGKKNHPIAPVKDAALPQLVYTRRTKAAINHRLNAGIKSRLEHNAKRFKGK